MFQNGGLLSTYHTSQLGRIGGETGIFAESDVEIKDMGAL